MQKKNCIYYALLLFLFVVNTSSYAQCAMCKTSAESDLQAGGSIAKGLNTGILYLMAIPYIILCLGAYFFFKKQIDARVSAWRKKRFPAKEL
jgi:hypothetical protein